jgi:metal-responsive CopG/Arc/MetJ family transcriptional regulator
MSNLEKMVRTSVTIPESLIEEFKEYCKKTRRSVSAQVTLLIEKELEAQKDKKN